ncbi:bifunctional tRNA (5-methylaminomethyl-2-thiouridine)(34)-methyltransferase MnmD/FAD-dependent 5-carboxymethylaminomethyl-2-thiouridine(34) oxidoreductase MnmC [Marinibactrum halimedae]|uniref:tRNA 5-methylaminomethyl-2-thiouridine biosynthesis bifunctional protein MnmC n=1 Tax=Marinibactrum halimedae TaxID=1444977 RepID=A0AA37T5D1_9GAMM|nr:bifunctional tRNA (5-methylaminomethyl-2-thiouridine)(34)-methyltransferase MnmD/FAD-dependent 5-carboxymethylaminomethyl-2-thiouridine(34) oxidoreductase MnmC [Marinibactrum halimedae]MCD9458616.1 bifunctional tRNA (5-methylaminomethyl-2-thiouridine)(34)-methyltransferase MnmD/FAD-dependent 5-carboxymethylaminomethyl-2-thiouridine(34) oxidoreductase MnmC [Marinibactrum halimedae]GLS26019.1 tRNA 5-methylaminomethyl-2-thiouridine biosynthesis bifunctional protein MnmC [Marinibactrum halimedae]
MTNNPTSPDSKSDTTSNTTPTASEARVEEIHLPPTASHAQLQWDEQGQPLSTLFDDVYFSKESGLEETRWVFLHHNRLAERLSELSPGDSFVVGETGFGSGLNFLAAWECWQNHAPADAHLHFVSVEKYPLPKKDLFKACALWPELSEFSQVLIQHYPRYLAKGFHRLNLSDCHRSVTLTLIVDDAISGLKALLANEHPAFIGPFAGRAVDAWFLDGFAPAKNPQMWQPELFSTLASLSHSGTTLATFTAAGVVKRGLADAGFTLKKVPGFGRKREMLTAFMTEPPARPAAETFKQAAYSSANPIPWMDLDKTSTEHLSTSQYAAPKDCTVAIIGAGLAGATTARALAERGFNVDVFEQHAAPGAEASGNPQGVLYTKPSHKEETLAQFNTQALQFAERFYTPFWADTQQYFGERCGVLHLAHSDKLHQLYEQVAAYYGSHQDLLEWVDANQASRIAGIPLEHAALYFPYAGWLSPPRLCESLLCHPNIRTRYSQNIRSIQRLETKEKSNHTHHWQIVDKLTNPIATAAIVVVATANQTPFFPFAADLPLKPIRGQVSMANASPTSAALKTVLCGDGYIAPAQSINASGQHTDAIDSIHCLGATFDLKSTDPQVRPEDHQRNWDNLHTSSPELAESLTCNGEGRVAFRCTTPDYLPLVGPAPISDEFKTRFALMSKNARAEIPLTGAYYPGLFMNVGHGSRGLAYTPICAELIAAYINGEPNPIGKPTSDALHPARFLIRDIKRRKS